MKAAVLVLLCMYCSVQCRKAYVPIDKNANLAFINMEAGGGARPSANQPPKPSSPAKPPSPTNAPVVPTQAPVKPIVTVVPPTPAPTKPSLNHTPAPVKPTPVKPNPVNYPTPAKPAIPTPVTTPGPGTVKQLVNFYDSQGKASPIRPYSYSQAVKQG